jgi:hypothetical protein
MCCGILPSTLTAALNRPAVGGFNMDRPGVDLEPAERARPARPVCSPLSQRNIPQDPGKRNRMCG